MKTNIERRDDIRDEMLIDIARGVQLLLVSATLQERVGPIVSVSPLTVIGRLESNISLLKGAK